eukprot:TRINITY_DN31013_c0_g1_i1.p1 TRINITY_DN31013_c0_g1~~TRINITY_DN31013_c0_g1_i1.p1  ORF type:complete len:160 (-),score=37.56 TRINITY_DN31013_c0_g1_i1:109-588(-)
MDRFLPNLANHRTLFVVAGSLVGLTIESIGSLLASQYFETKFSHTKLDLFSPTFPPQHFDRPRDIIPLTKLATFVCISVFALHKLIPTDPPAPVQPENELEAERKILPDQNFWLFFGGVGVGGVVGTVGFGIVWTRLLGFFNLLPVTNEKKKKEKKKKT